jgi:hypothetical protein
MSNDIIIRTLSVVAAAVLLAGPTVVAKVRSLFSGEAPREGLTDAHTVLEIANRLKASGCDKGVALCQQLIDVMLSPEGGKAK